MKNSLFLYLERCARARIMETSVIAKFYFWQTLTCRNATAFTFFRQSWGTPENNDFTPERSYKKESGYAHERDRPSSIETPKRKRPKIDMKPRETPESESSRSGRLVAL